MKENDLHRLLLLIETQLGWGDSGGWPSKDFERLNILIQERTKISISASTLRRVWGKVGYTNQPSFTTLDTLAQFAGYESWRSFCSSGKATEHYQPTVAKASTKGAFRRHHIIITALFAVPVIIGSMLLIKSGSTNSIKKYAFDYRHVTRDLPNSVIFTYDASSASSDSVFIQQSWDDSRRAHVSKTSHTNSSIYYKPGFYHAKLVVGTQVVKEIPLLIPTNGWLGMIDQQPVPVYLDHDEFVTKNGMSITTSTLRNHQVPLEPQPPVVAFYNTGNFTPLSILNFSYSAEVKNSYKIGASKCQQLNVILFTSGIPISIPLSEPGCIASLSMLDGVNQVNGNTADLSAFGTDPSKWVNVSCVSHNGHISISVDNKIAYKYLVADKSLTVLGVGFRFHGTGSVRHVALSSNNKLIFQDF